MAKSQTLERIVDATVQSEKDPKNIQGEHSLVLYLAQQNDAIEPWGGNPAKRDQDLANFWPTEPYLASAIMSIAMTRAALSWELSGPPKTVEKVQKLLNGADFGSGWQHLIMQVNTDILTTENGGFIEIIRDKPKRGRKPESMPVIGIAHLSSLQCIKTGNPLTPVIYIDDDGGEHFLKWYQVVNIVENPIPESKTGRQLCFVSRVLKFSSIIRDVLTHHAEKIGGRFTKAIHVISGVSQSEIDKIQNRAQLDRDNQGLLRYGQPLILTALDPNARVNKETIELATLPDGFDFDQLMNWYVTLLALASGSDYQEFAPLSSGNLGTASQSDTLHRKAQRKGTQLFIKLVENALVQSRVIPGSIGFRFQQQDAQAEGEQVEIAAKRGNSRMVRIQSGEITPEIARQIAVDQGDLKQEYLLMMQEQDQTPNITIADDETVSELLLQAQDGKPISVVAPVSSDETTNEQTDEEPEDEKGINVNAAWEAGLWFVKIINGSPLQGISPISDTKLKVFAQSVRNMLLRYNKAIVIGTDNVWLDPLLIQAAKAAGIEPMALRSRLPNNYRVNVYSRTVKDNRGSVIYKSMKPKQKDAYLPTFKVPMQKLCKCGKAATTTTFGPVSGWNHTCKEHTTPGNLEITFSEVTTYDIIDLFKDQYEGVTNKLLLTLSAIKLIGATVGYIPDLKDLSERVRKIIPVTKTPEPLVALMLTLIYGHDQKV